MADESPINTFDLSVKLPITDASPPDLFFKINFNCNGVITISDSFASALDALEWCQDELASFGTWSVSDNTLYLSESLCGVGSLYLTVTSQSQGDEVIMEIDDSNPQAVLNIFGVSFVDVSLNDQRITDTEWLDEMTDCHWKYADAYADPITQWYHVKPLGGGDGYNIRSAEAIARGKTLATVLDGVGNVTYGYDFFVDEYAEYLPVIGVTESIFSINIASLLIQVIGTNPVNVAGINFTDMYAEWEFYITTLANNGVTIRSIQLCTELGIQNQSDIVHSATDVKNICVSIITYFRTNHPSFTIYCDAYEVDDPTSYLANYNSTLNTMDIEGARQYLQFDADLDTLEKNFDRADELPSILTRFTQVFTGKKIRLQQEVVKPGNPYRLKVGEGLIMVKLWMNVIRENVTRSNLISDLTFYNATRLMGNNNTIFPMLRFAQLGSGMFNNNGMIEVTFDNDNLEIIGFKKGSGAEVYILNKSSDFQEIDIVKLNGTAKTVTIESWYGNDRSDEVNHFTDTASAVLIYPHGLTKIVTT